jgi:hypothetical protein
MKTRKVQARPGRLLVLLALGAAAGCSKQPVESAPPPLPATEAIANTRQVMLGLTIPASDVVFQVGAAAPTDDAGWEKVQANAAMLAESANLLLTPPRAIDAPEWTGFAKTLIAASKTALQAAQAHDVDKVLEAGNQIYEVCDGCHRKYMAARAGE